MNYRRLLVLGASAVALAVAAPGAFAQISGPAAEDDKDAVVIVGRTIEETLPQELEKFGSDLEIVTSEEIRNQLFVDAQQAIRYEIYINGTLAESVIGVGGTTSYGEFGFNVITIIAIDSAGNESDPVTITTEI